MNQNISYNVSETKRQDKTKEQAQSPGFRPWSKTGRENKQNVKWRKLFGKGCMVSSWYWRNLPNC